MFINNIICKTWWWPFSAAVYVVVFSMLIVHKKIKTDSPEQVNAQISISVVIRASNASFDADTVIDLCKNTVTH